MALTVNTNVSSLNAQRNLTKSGEGLATSMERLSSGMRINSAKDDAAGLQISNRLTSQINGLAVAQRNANDGISMAQTAEGAMNESTNILQRMRELALQSANGSNSDTDRAALQKEVSALQTELTRIAETTSFGGQQLLDGTYGTKLFQVGANANETISMSLSSVRANEIGANQVNISSAAAAGFGQVAAAASSASAPADNGVAATSSIYTITGKSGVAETVTITANSTAKEAAELINVKSGETGVTANAKTQVSISGDLGSGSVSFKLNDQVISSNASYSDIASAVNDKSNAHGVTATLADDGTLVLTDTDGDDIRVDDYVNSDAAKTATVAGIDYEGSVSTVTNTLTSGAAGDSSTISGALKLSSTETFSITSNNASIAPAIGTQASELEDVNSIDISTQDDSQLAIDVIDSAIAMIDDQRADLGAIQNRFSHTISNLANISENVSASRSRIQDTDFATETAQMTKNQILQQAGTSILSQANQIPQAAISLLGG
ncbi:MULTISPECIES: flagellin [Pseudoalteromonas]|uniref:Flagellin n=1 Tax=Pseudoalteromonas arctica TaxID=394751 RepID=A0ABU9TJS5_9GAMM|nr:flagellin [Pseudoalteromonas sp. NZS11]MBH0078557.1 flagellin [Pseudoalteromonas sp. NZS11]